MCPKTQNWGRMRSCTSNRRSWGWTSWLDVHPRFSKLFQALLSNNPSSFWCRKWLFTVYAILHTIQSAISCNLSISHLTITTDSMISTLFPGSIHPLRFKEGNSASPRPKGGPWTNKTSTFSGMAFGAITGQIQLVKLEPFPRGWKIQENWNHHLEILQHFLFPYLQGGLIKKLNHTRGCCICRLCNADHRIESGEQWWLFSREM